MAFPSFIQSSFILEEAVNPESAKDSVRYRASWDIAMQKRPLDPDVTDTAPADSILTP
ncbi:hypothetical protein QA649_04355 [Bradyrhizobium sp. CB1717]|uniref:hypothetical protein n=1 Tax=Bradyrhizobium sp. CB1717 TaxID=3039154 RepID=UPI0024B0ACBF|nr:hypothetical protein [Bradyrhizobium sp. CB1717]WFU25483.1 hypothetical protein QA649_04355 [Bradyrhizobium sp. CB1717]